MRSIEQRPIVGKFGGTSMASSETIMRSAEIVKKERMLAVVVSAPGKRNPTDIKVTDLLLDCSRLASEGKPFDNVFDEIIQRYEEIGRGLNIHPSVVGLLSTVYQGISENNGKAWIASRGEWIVANAFSEFTEGHFIDSKDLIKLKNNGVVDPISYDLINARLNKNILYIVPGFYGSDENGSIQIFARGGSDITGAIIARGVNASEYQNWTDVNGVRSADPKIVKNPKFIPEITFGEMRELSYRGADILQMDSVLPVAEKGIPVVIKNTFNPSSEGTKIITKRNSRGQNPVIGVAGREGFVSVQIGKMGMNNERGIAREILDIFDTNGVSIEHDPTTIDNMSVITRQDQIADKLGRVINDLEISIHPDILSPQVIGLVCIVGQEISEDATDIFAQFSQAFKQKGIKIKAVSFPTGGNSIIIGVENKFVKDAIREIYDACIK